MTASESLKLYQLFFQLTKNESEAKSFVSEFERSIDNTVETKFAKEKEKFVPRNEFEKVEFKIDLLRQEIKTLVVESEVKMATRINNLIIWIVSTGIAITSIIIAFLKMKP